MGLEGSCYRNHVLDQWDRVVLEVVQRLSEQHAYPYQREALGPLPRRVFFPLEFPPDAERDVRSSDRGSLTILERAPSNSARSIGPIPRASSCAMNSDSLPPEIASDRVILIRFALGCVTGPRQHELVICDLRQSDIKSQPR
jgi:hypothetical protein